MPDFKTLLKYLLILFLILDLSYSFLQYFNMPLDGDMAHIIVPAEEFKQVMQDPLGMDVLLHGESYPNPNRFFAHWASSLYFKTMPLALQSISEPITSVYLASAIAKILIQFLLIFLLVLYTSNCRRIFDLRFLIPAALIIPLFQTVGYSRYMGIIDQSVIYTFFYALPLALMLIYYLPVYRMLNGNQNFRLGFVNGVLLTLLAFILAFSGPLVPAVMIIVNGIVLLRIWFKNIDLKKDGSMVKKILPGLSNIPFNLAYLLLISLILSLYSIFIGMHNSLNDMTQLSVIDYYTRLPLGLFNLIAQKLGWPFLIIFVIMNMIIIRKQEPGKERDQIIHLFNWILIFTLVYILLLPLGGFRWYRPNAIRYDTFIPVTLAFVFIFARSSYYLINTLKLSGKKIYVLLIIGFALFFTINDNPNFGSNTCEKEQFERLSASKENPVELPGDCTLMSWEKILDPRDSELQAELIYYWKITNEKKLYYQK